MYMAFFGCGLKFTFRLSMQQGGVRFLLIRVCEKKGRADIERGKNKAKEDILTSQNGVSKRRSQFF